jgi:hypothetical protein
MTTSLADRLAGALRTTSHSRPRSRPITPADYDVCGGPAAKDTRLPAVAWAAG